jgi:hypothetical protein
MKLNKLSSILSAALVVSAAAFSTSALADSAVGAGGAPNTAQARLDFQVTIPKVLQFRVGNAAAGTVDLITFAPTAAQVGNAVAVVGAGGDLGGGAVTARVVANSGQVTITAATLGALNNGATGTIAWSEITTTATVLTSVAALAAPVLQNGPAASPAVNAPAPVNGVTVADARWTFGYANTTVPPAGVYGGVNIRNSRVTYTASAP